MTKEEFLQLQSDHQSSGLSLKLYLKQIGTCYSTYNYWRKKYCSQEECVRDLAPIRFLQREATFNTITSDMPSGATLLFPNGLHAHFGIGTEDVLRELLDKSLVSHVLP